MVPRPAEVPEDACEESLSFNGTVSPDWIGLKVVCLDRSRIGHPRYRFLFYVYLTSEFLTVVQSF